MWKLSRNLVDKGGKLVFGLRKGNNNVDLPGGRILILGGNSVEKGEKLGERIGMGGSSAWMNVCYLGLERSHREIV